jgi:hypothetical protein
MSATTRGIFYGIGILAFGGSLIGQFLSRVPDYFTTAFAFVGILCLVVVAKSQKKANASGLPPSPQKERNRTMILFAVLFLGVIAGYFVIRRDMPQLGANTAASSALFALIFGVAVILWAERSRKSGKTFLHKKRAWFIGLVVVVFPVAIFLNYLDRYGDVCRRIDYQIGLANAELNRGPANISKLQNYVRSLRAIDTRGAPSEVQQTFNDYIIVFERATTEFQVTGKSGIADQQIASTQKAFAETVKRYK